MVTDGIMGALNIMQRKALLEIDKETLEDVIEMLGDYDEDQWYLMTDEEKEAWIEGYMNHII